MVHWQSPRFFAYFAANASLPALLADMWASATNMIGFSWAGSPVATELEAASLEWLRRLCGLPDTFRAGGAPAVLHLCACAPAVIVALERASRLQLSRFQACACACACAYTPVPARVLHCVGALRQCMPCIAWCVSCLLSLRSALSAGATLGSITPQPRRHATILKHMP